MKPQDKLKILSARLDRMIENGGFHALPFWKRYALVARVKLLHSSFLGPVSPAAARAILAGAAALALAACPTAGGSSDPSFAAAAKNPFGFQPVVTTLPGPLAPAFADVNGDGVADLFAGAGGESVGVIAYFANTGTRSSPSLAAPVDAPLLPGASSKTNFGPVPVLAPLTGGPNWDALIGHSNGGALPPILEFHKNNGITFDATTTLSVLPTSASNSLTATVVDINGDGLLDIFVSTSDGTTATIEYWKNTGPASAPVFVDQGTTLGLNLPAGKCGFPTFVDINGDGTFDAFVGNDAGDIYFFKNVGTRTVPQFAAPVKNPFGITPVTGPAIPAFVDIDNDGDPDLFVGDGNGDLWFFRNNKF